MDEVPVVAEVLAPKLGEVEEIERRALPVYDKTVAAKKAAWAIAKYGMARGMAPQIMPVVIAGFEKLAALLKPAGIGITLDHVVFEAALPTIIFVVLVGAHDAIKVKTGAKWL